MLPRLWTRSSSGGWPRRWAPRRRSGAARCARARRSCSGFLGGRRARRELRPVLPRAVLRAAAAGDRAARRRRRARRVPRAGRARELVAAGVALAGLATPIGVEADLLLRATPDQVTREVYGRIPFVEAPELGRRIAELTAARRADRGDRLGARDLLLRRPARGDRLPLHVSADGAAAARARHAERDDRAARSGAAGGTGLRQRRRLLAGAAGSRRRSSCSLVQRHRSARLRGGRAGRDPRRERDALAASTQRTREPRRTRSTGWPSCAGRPA